MPLSAEALAAYLTPFVPRDYSYLLPSEELRPADLVTLCAAMAWMHEWKREDLAGWYRPLALTLFERFGLLELPQRRAVQELTSGPELLQALGIVESPDWFDALGRAWFMRSRVLALPEMASGALQGHPFQLSIRQRNIPSGLQPMASEVADDLAAHARAANALVQKLDRSIVALWGCPPERLDQRVTVAELVAGGLELQTFEP